MWGSGGATPCDVQRATPSAPGFLLAVGDHYISPPHPVSTPLTKIFI